MSGIDGAAEAKEARWVQRQACMSIRNIVVRSPDLRPIVLSKVRLSNAVPSANEPPAGLSVSICHGSNLTIKLAVQNPSRAMTWQCVAARERSRYCAEPRQGTPARAAM